jgi:valyl-tRNA synthetase/predicted alpha/beta hydrolase family esterase
MPLSTNYNPKDNETQIYSQWMDVKIGCPELQNIQNMPLSEAPQSGGVQSSKTPNNTKTHAILMPPPNLTGDLHAGHAFQHYLMDTLSRLARQRGEKNLWFPGVDHAGLQLEGVIDKLIKKGEFDEIINKVEEGLSFQNSQNSNSNNVDIKSTLHSIPKDDLPKYLKTNYPELWLECAWSKVNLWRDNQKNQSAILGDTPDYDRSLFTLDPQNLDMVNYAFQKYWQDGLIYKGSYLVNWSVGLMTALSDVAGEIEYEKRIDPFVTFEYGVSRIEYTTDELKSKYSELKIKPTQIWKRPQLSTVRPETKFTDIAIAMHPSKFPIYFNQDIFESDNTLNKSFLQDIFDNKINIYFNLPPLHDKELILILTEKVDPDFGTGIMKITPAHDPFDYELGKELLAEGKLKTFKADACIGRDGKLTAEFAGEFAGMVAQESRGAIFKRLIETGYIPLKPNYEGEIPEFEKISDQEFWTWKQDKQYEWLKQNYPQYDINWNYEHNVTICERTKTVVEPLISEEFFISYHKEFSWTPTAKDLNTTIVNKGKITNLQSLGIEAVNATSFYSPEYKERGINFLENIKDWCISRDLIWGHKMPVWYNLDTNPDKIFYSFEQVSSIRHLERSERSHELGVKTSNIDNHFAISVTRPTTPGNWVQEEKILDTWFSSCLWPLSSLKYPEFVKNQAMQPNIVIIHGGESWQNRDEYISNIESGNLNSYWYGNEMRPKSSSWKLAVQKHCKENQIPILAPQFPNKTNADYKKWKMVFEQSLPYINSNTVLVGHSLGSMFLTKYLSENNINCNAVFLVAGGLNNSSDSFESPQNLNNLNQLGDKVYIIHSKDDKVVDFVRSVDLKGKLEQANFIELENYGHLSSQCPELLEMIKEQIGAPVALRQPLVGAYTPAQGSNSAGVWGWYDFSTFYPTQEMTTGKDIFYQWIVRMTTLSYYFTAQIPYENLVITPTILDDKGKKMSKSLGNGMDPVAQINKYSSDAMRMAMLGGMIPDRNIKMGGRLADELCEKYRNFGNKMWNIARFFEYQEEKDVK